MAYPTVSAPYGLKPVKLIGGQVFAGATRQIKIVSGYPTAIYYGDVVKLVSTGTHAIDTGTTTATPVGTANGYSGGCSTSRSYFGWGLWWYAICSPKCFGTASR